MGILSRAGDLVYTLRFLRLLTTPWENTTAFELGLIDNKGKTIKKASTPEEKSAHNAFHKLVFNIKKLLPGKRFGSYAAALFLLKEKYGVANFEKILKENNIEYQAYIYPEVNHGFHNNTTPRYDKEAAYLSWERTIEFFNKHLK